MLSKVLQLLAQGGEIARLLPIIQLAQKSLAELIQHLGELVALAEFGVPVHELRNLVQRIARQSSRADDTEERPGCNPSRASANLSAATRAGHP